MTKLNCYLSIIQFVYLAFYSLKGHKGLITQCYFMKSQNILLTRWVMTKITAGIFYQVSKQVPNLMEDFNGFTGTHCIKCQNSVFSIYQYLFFVPVPTDLFWTRHTNYLLMHIWLVYKQWNWVGCTCTCTCSLDMSQTVKLHISL